MPPIGRTLRGQSSNGCRRRVVSCLLLSPVCAAEAPALTSPDLRAQTISGRRNNGNLTRFQCLPLPPVLASTSFGPRVVVCHSADTPICSPEAPPSVPRFHRSGPVLAGDGNCKARVANIDRQTLTTCRWCAQAAVLFGPFLRSPSAPPMHFRRSANLL